MHTRGAHNTGSILITGVSGYVGQHLLRHLDKEGAQAVVGVDTITPLFAPPRMRFYQLDIRQPYLHEIIARERPRALVHLSFVMNPRLDLRLMHDINVGGTRNTLDAAAGGGVAKVIVMSSTAVYGAHPDNPPALTEDTPLRGHPSFPYVRDQIAVEHLAAGHAAAHPSMSVVILRPCVIYGRRNPSFLLDFLRRLPVLPMPGGLNPPLQFIHVDDLVNALRLALSRGEAGAYNVIGRGTVMYAEAAQIMGKRTVYVPRRIASTALDLLGMVGLFAGVPQYTLDFVSYPWLADGSKAARDLGYRPKISAREALESMLDT